MVRPARLGLSAMSDVVSKSQERMSSIEVDRGLYAVKYVGPLSKKAPAAFVEAAAGSGHLIRMLSSPGASERSVLPGSVLVLAVEALATIQITVRAVTGDFEARFELEQLDKAKISPVDVTRSVDPAVPVLGAGGAAGAVDDDRFVAFDLLGHVSRRGDVRVANSTWLAGPADPAQIEGFALQAPDVEYQALVSGEGRWSDWQSSGAFVGTRARNLPLIGVRFRVSSRAPARMMLRASALFLGSSTIEKFGREIELRSAAGGDPLIGLMVDNHLPVAVSAPVVPEAQSSPRSRVRVFRSGQLSLA